METLVLPAASLVGLSLLLGWVAHASSQDGLDRNSLIGIRTKATLASDEAWRLGHRAASGAVRTAAWLCGLLGLTGAVLAVLDIDYAPVAVLAGYAAFLILTVLAVRRASRAARPAE